MSSQHHQSGSFITAQRAGLSSDADAQGLLILTDGLRAERLDLSVDGSIEAHSTDGTGSLSSSGGSGAEQGQEAHRSGVGWTCSVYHRWGSPVGLPGWGSDGASAFADPQGQPQGAGPVDGFGLAALADSSGLEAVAPVVVDRGGEHVAGLLEKLLLSHGRGCRLDL